MTDRRTLRPYAMLAAAMLFWAGNAIAGRVVRDDIPPATLSLMRWVGALALLLPFAWPHLVRDRAILIAAWPRVVVIGLLGIAAFNAIYYFGLHYTTASNGLLLQALIPTLVLICDRLIFGIRPGWSAVAGVAVSTIGVAFIVFRGDPALLTGFVLSRGDAIILVAVVVWALYTSLLRTKPDAHPLAFLAATFAVGLAALLPLAVAELTSGAQLRWTSTTVAVVGYVAVFPSLLSYSLFSAGVAALGAGRAGQTINLMPLFGALLAAALLGETLHGYHAIGMALILIGLAIGLLGARALRRT
ncbi:DMT family transporter [uncultured Sphingomonas sp.]|uniref:DMT family transporter n=1 Tax=uncultured Sphingomonas sp. TaxID=158754 RepID=UPI0025FAD261|nr:DMT family transporter [uncultured Sphingomonas sp.]